MIGTFERDVHTPARACPVDDLGDERMIGLCRDEVVSAPDGQHVGVALRPIGGQVLAASCDQKSTERPSILPAGASFARVERKSGRAPRISSGRFCSISR